MSEDAVLSLQSHSTTVDYRGKVPVEHLDYDYIEKCKDVRYLEKILRTLRSGEEGIYPHLIKFCESHLEKLDPKSRALRKEMPVATAASLSKDEWNQIEDELKRWQEETKKTETTLKHQSVFDDLVKENMPPVRGFNCFVPLSQKTVPQERKKPSKCALPRDYREWDKFDVEKECEKIEEDVDKTDPPAIINSGHPKIKTQVDTSLLSQQEKLFLANREKDKGNEAFRAKDYEEAVTYYSRSLSIITTVAAYNNRAQAEIKLEHWHNALKDCLSVLELEPGNLKALLRRAVVYNHMGNFHMATEDLRTVLREEPQNTPATVGDGTEASTPVERGDMGNAHKKPHGRGDGGPHAESNSSHHEHRRNRGSSDKYKVPQEKIANGSSKRGSTASVQGDQSGSGKATPVGGNAGETVNLDAPCGALPPPLARLKNEGNLLFKNGQFADALEKYSQAIQGYTDSEDLCILYSNRAACYLKDGNSQDCIQDCTRALELQPFSLKPLLRRAMAYESLERYRKAYVDYKTVLQIDVSVQAAHDSVNRITRLLIEQDGPEWREKLPEIPLVPLSAQQHRREEPPSAEVLQARAEKAARDAGLLFLESRSEVRFSALKQEGNDFVKKSQYQDALGKYTECLKLKSEECTIYTNRALCYLKLERFAEAKQDCDAALKLEPTNKKAFYRRAMANKGLKVNRAIGGADFPDCDSLTETGFPFLSFLFKCFTHVRLPPQVEDDENVTAVPNSKNSCKGEDISINLQPASAYEFGQSLNAARSSGNTVACAELLASTAPEMLPQFLSTQLDGHTISFIMQALHSHLLEKDPYLVYQHLNHLHTADRFSVVLMLLEKEERHHMTQLFEDLSAVQSTQFTKNDVQNLANKYI
uniref:RNA-polymerase II-associated protein 3-like C-terminal domain-containing protein n=1 Tax=Astatotilapia calliptera TaxID=8154 RepID=A0A3P8PCR5_ASTCA